MYESRVPSVVPLDTDRVANSLNPSQFKATASEPFRYKVIFYTLVFQMRWSNRFM
jgi:hypothetical protein